MASSDVGSAHGPNAELAAQRLKLFEDAVALRKPDRVPLMPLALQYFHTRVAGVSDKDAGYDARLNFDCLRDATVRFGWDWAPGMAVPPSRSLEALGSKQIRWPGGDLPDDVPVPVGRGRVPQGRRVRRLPLGPDPVHSAHPVAAPRERLRRARRAAAAARLVDQHHVLPAGLGGAAGGAADDGHVRGARGDEPGRGSVHGARSGPSWARWPGWATRWPSSESPRRPSTPCPTTTAACAAAHSTCTGSRTSCRR